MVTWTGKCQRANMGHFSDVVKHGNGADEVLSQCPGARMVIVHDVAASKLPFEMLASDSSIH